MTNKLLPWIVLSASLLFVGCDQAPNSVTTTPAGDELPIPVERPSTGDSNQARRDWAVYFTQVTESPEFNKRNPNGLIVKAEMLLSEARSTVDVCGFEIDNERFVEALLRCHRRGVKVRVVTDTEYQREYGPVELSRAMIPVVTDKRDDLMHNKFMIIDNEVVWTGSANFTENCFYRNQNNAIAIKSKALAAVYTEKFRWMFDIRKFGGKPTGVTLPENRITLRDGTKVEAMFATHDQIDRRLIEMIRNAKSSVRFMVYSFTHASLANAMMEAGSRGVEVVGVMEARQQSKFWQYDRLSQSGNVNVMLDGHPYNMHHKVLIIDDRYVVVGSYNFSAGASTANDENVLIIESPAIVEHYLEEFLRIKTQAEQEVAQFRRSRLR